MKGLWRLPVWPLGSCVTTGKTAGPSTPLRFGRDDKVRDKSVTEQMLSLKTRNTNLVIPTGA
jgi:hypothetical protein